MLWPLSTKPFSKSFVDLSLCLHFIVVMPLNTLDATWLMDHTDKTRTARAESDTSLISPHSAQVFTAMLMFCVQLWEKERIRMTCDSSKRKKNWRSKGWAVSNHFWLASSAVWTGIWATTLNFLCLPLSHCQTVTGTSDLDLPQKKQAVCSLGSVMYLGFDLESSSLVEKDPSLPGICGFF